MDKRKRLESFISEEAFNELEYIVKELAYPSRRITLEKMIHDYYIQLRYGTDTVSEKEDTVSLLTGTVSKQITDTVSQKIPYHDTVLATGTDTVSSINTASKDKWHRSGASTQVKKSWECAECGKGDMIQEGYCFRCSYQN